jgi:leucyl aminopeptidase
MMTFDPHFAADGTPDLPILAVGKAGFKQWLEAQPVARRGWVDAAGFAAEPGSLCLLPDEKGVLEGALFGWDKDDFWAFANLPAKLPGGVWRIDTALTPVQADAASLVWGLGHYQFSRYKSAPAPAAAKPRLTWPAAADRDHTLRLINAIGLARDLVNTPANDLGPEELAAAARRVAQQHGAEFRVIIGADLLTENYPAIHAVGRAAAPHRAPRLIDLRWGDPNHPKLTLVGKGVCFDSGGLDLKPSSGMKLMKKDMGGAAVSLALADAIMAASLPVRLRLLIPAVENAVSGDAFHPLDIIKTKKGLTVEIGNTDAEGRLILCDALTEAETETPDLLLNFATLTGAARTALGPDLPALFTRQDALADDLLKAGRDAQDPLWRLPLWAPYRRMLDSKVADINNASDSPHAGAITAGLFLAEFVAPTTQWAHLDLFAWNPTSRPGRPEGGEAMGLRAIYSAIRQRYPS